MLALRRQPDASRSLLRRGSMLPALAISLLVVGSCLALVLDSLWLKMARRELQTAADAAVLAAAGELASDELLKVDPDRELLALRARKVAANVAALNRAAGKQVFVDPLIGEDVRLGRITQHENGTAVFLETDQNPTAVVLLAHCGRAQGNPVSLFFPHLTGEPTGDVTCRAEASINNQVYGVRPLDNAPVPALPLAILESHSDPRRLETWALQIEARRGQDRYRFNAETGEVERGQDGIPEIVLHSTPPGSEEEEEQRGNVQIVDLGTNLQLQQVQRQITHGWSWRDLQDLGTELRLDQGPVQLRSSERIENTLNHSLQEMIGKSRIVLLYSATGPGGPNGVTSAEISRLVAGRIMDVKSGQQTLEMVLQPAVINTRLALVNEDPFASSTQFQNQYIRRLSLTN